MKNNEKTFSEMHEDILMFLEDNISKLVKLKVASRAKYKEYDDNYMSYTVADNIGDEERIQLYGSFVTNNYMSMRKKLCDALDANPDLAENDTVAEYMELVL